MANEIILDSDEAPDGEEKERAQVEAPYEIRAEEIFRNAADGKTIFDYARGMGKSEVLEILENAESKWLKLAQKRQQLTEKPAARKEPDSKKGKQFVSSSRLEDPAQSYREKAEEALLKRSESQSSFLG